MFSEAEWASIAALFSHRPPERATFVATRLLAGPGQPEPGSAGPGGFDERLGDDHLRLVREAVERGEAGCVVAASGTTTLSLFPSPILAAQRSLNLLRAAARYNADRRGSEPLRIGIGMESAAAGSAGSQDDGPLAAAAGVARRLAGQGIAGEITVGSEASVVVAAQLDEHLPQPVLWIPPAADGDPGRLAPEAAGRSGDASPPPPASTVSSGRAPAPGPQPAPAYAGERSRPASPHPAHAGTRYTLLPAPEPGLEGPNNRFLVPALVAAIIALLVGGVMWYGPPESAPVEKDPLAGHLQLAAGQVARGTRPPRSEGGYIDLPAEGWSEVLDRLRGHARDLQDPSLQPRLSVTRLADQARLTLWFPEDVNLRVYHSDPEGGVVALRGPATMVRAGREITLSWANPLPGAPESLLILTSDGPIEARGGLLTDEEAPAPAGERPYFRELQRVIDRTLSGGRGPGQRFSLTVADFKPGPDGQPELSVDGVPAGNH